MLKVYLDNCCLFRPFDDQRIVRNRLDSNAIRDIMALVRQGAIELVSSTVLDLEIERAKDLAKKAGVQILMAWATHYVEIEPLDTARTKELCKLGFKPLDALHIVAAEKGGRDFY